MAVVNLKSPAIGNAEAVPIVYSDSWNAPLGGRLKESGGTVACNADDSASSTYQFCRIPSNARVSQILFSAADAITAGAIDIGLYAVAADGGAVLDADLFASAFDLAGGPFNNQDVTYESGQYTYTEADKPLWQVLGLPKDPSKEYEVVGVVTINFNGGPTSMRVEARFV